MTAFVFNCDYNGLSVIQSLGRHSVNVHALDSHRNIGSYSRYGTFRRVPDVLSDERGFIKALHEARNQCRDKPVLFPTNDHWAEAVSRHKEALEQDFHCCVCDYETIDLLLDKFRFGRWAAQNDLPVPKVWSPEEFLDEEDRLYPVALKANSRRRAGNTAHAVARARAADRLRFRKCHGREEVEGWLREAAVANIPVFMQELLHGRSDAMRTIGIYARDGKLHGVLYGRKVRGYPPSHGDCVVGQAEPVPEWAATLAERFASLTNYTGIAEIEVMYDSTTERHLLIEVNPRSWSWVGVSAKAGVDLPWLAYQDLKERISPPQTVYGCADGRPVYYAKVLQDMQNSFLWYRYTEAQDWVQTPVEWLEFYRQRPGVLAEFAKDDPLVGLVSAAKSTRMFVTQLGRVLTSPKADDS